MILAHLREEPAPVFGVITLVHILLQRSFQKTAGRYSLTNYFQLKNLFWLFLSYKRPKVWFIGVWIPLIFIKVPFHIIDFYRNIVFVLPIRYIIHNIGGYNTQWKLYCCNQHCDCLVWNKKIFLMAVNNLPVGYSLKGWHTREGCCCCISGLLEKGSAWNW